ncbi:hypothetical protein ACKWTF_000727 [Chironomus riparius]
MRFTFQKVFILLAFVAEIRGLELKTIHDTFDEVFVIKLMLPEDDLVRQLLNQFNETCMAEYMQLSKYGGKLVNEFEQNLLVDSASYMCTGSAADQLSKTLKVNTLKSFNLDEDDDFIACLSSKLLTLEPTTKLAVYDRTKTCKTSFVNFLPEHLKSYLKNTNAQVTKSTCDQITADYNTKIFVKQYLLLLKNVEANLKKNEDEQLLKQMKFMWKAGYHCMFNRFKNEH